MKDIETEENAGIIGQIVAIYDPNNKITSGTEFNIGKCKLKHLGKAFKPSGKLEERYNVFCQSTPNIPSFKNMSLIGAPLHPVFSKDDKTSFKWDASEMSDTMYSVRGLYAKTEGEKAKERGSEHLELKA